VTRGQERLAPSQPWISRSFPVNQFIGSDVLDVQEMQLEKIAGVNEFFSTPDYAFSGEANHYRY
jgi:hypothetical protein